MMVTISSHQAETEQLPILYINANITVLCYFFYAILVQRFINNYTMHAGYGFECAGLKTLYCTDSAYTFSLKYKKIKASETMQSLAIPKYHFSLDGFFVDVLTKSGYNKITV